MSLPSVLPDARNPPKFTRGNGLGGMGSLSTLITNGQMPVMIDTLKLILKIEKLVINVKKRAQ